MKIISLNPKNRKQWKDWVDIHPQSTFYHRAEWKDVIEMSFGHRTYYLMAEKEENIYGILPLVHLRSLLFGNILCSMPFLNFGGVCADTTEAHGALIEEAERIMKRIRAKYVEFRHLQPAPLDLLRNEHKVSMTIELTDDPDEIWGKFKTKHRTNIRRAAKNDLKVIKGGEDLVNDFYRILSIGWRDLGTPIYGIDFFRNIFKAFGESVEIFMVYHRGIPVATAFNGLFRETVEGMWAFALREYVKLQPNYVLYWEMIKDACNRGYKQFHLGRSTNKSGATFFKSKWNANIHQLYWEYILNEKKCEQMPELNVNNPKYQPAINMWRRMPVGITRWIGPYISKNIP